MKQQESIAEKIVNNLNNVIGSIPRTLNFETKAPARRRKKAAAKKPGTRKAKNKISRTAGKAKRAASRTVSKAKRKAKGAKKAVSRKVGARRAKSRKITARPMARAA